MFIEEIIKNDKLLQFYYNRLRLEINKNDIYLYKYIDNYFFQYCKFNNISINFILKTRNKFSKRYQTDIKNFEDSGKYPFQLSNQNFKINRIEYDIILILSFLTEIHRFRIAYWLSKLNYGREILVVGCGPGVELGIIREFCGYTNSNFHLYDINSSPFVEDKFSCKINNEYFMGSDILKFTDILLIEILEHLSDPYVLIENVSNSLINYGNVYLTTANNMPQFDHLYNFKIGEINNFLQVANLNLSSYEILDHHYLTSNIKPSNELIVANYIN